MTYSLPDPEATWDHLFYPPAAAEYTYFEHAAAFPFRPAAPTYDPVNALWAAECAFLSYGRYAQQRIPSTAFHQLLTAAGFDDLTPIGDWTKSPSGTQGFFAWRPDWAVMSFRGTEKEDWLDLAADLFLVPTLYSDEPRTEGFFERVARTIPRLLPVLLQSDQIGVHSGFLAALDVVWHDVQHCLDAYRDTYPRSPIVFTGHSLGAALATIAAARYSRGPSILYTYGSPRVGNLPFREKLVAATQGRIFRLVNGSDLVTTVPPKSDTYIHVTTNQLHITAPGVIVEGMSASTAWQEVAGALASAARAVRNIAENHGPPVPLRDHSPLFYLNRLKSGV